MVMAREDNRITMEYIYNITYTYHIQYDVWMSENHLLNNNNSMGM